MFKETVNENFIVSMTSKIQLCNIYQKHACSVSVICCTVVYINGKSLSGGQVRSRVHTVALYCSVRPHLHIRICHWFIYQYVSRYLISFYFGLHQQQNFEVILSMLLNKVWNEWKLLKLWPIFPINVHVTSWVI